MTHRPTYLRYLLSHFEWTLSAGAACRVRGVDGVHFACPPASG